MTLQKIQETEIATFINNSQKWQQEFISKINIQELKQQQDKGALKKFIAMKVLMEARCAAENQNPLSLTAQFRNLLAFFGLRDLILGADAGTSKNRLKYPGEDIEINGYRLFHINDMGRFNWNRKFFNIQVNDDNSITTEKVNTHSRLGEEIKTISSDKRERDLLKKEDLRELFAEIQEEARYENTFGYDLLSAGMFCANGLIYLGLHTNIVVSAIALLLNVAIYTIIAPPALALMAIESLVVNPIKALVSGCLPQNKHEDFINEVFSEPTPMK